MKASIETVQEVLSKNNLDPATVKELLKQIEEQTAAEAEEEKANRDPAVKKQFVCIVSDPNGDLANVPDLVCWVAQIPEDDAVSTSVERIVKAAYEYNISKKGRKYPVKTIGETCESVGARFFKENAIAIKTKSPVLLLRTDNKIPEIKEDF